MINSLQIKNFGIIEELNVDFSNGFNVLTGETGAGKSILIKALSALLGAKSGVELIRVGEERAEISAIFTVTKLHPVIASLKDLGIPFEGDLTHEIIFRRTISLKGKNGTWLNDVPVSKHCARELGQKLMDIFGQNDSFRLATSQCHSKLLERFLPSELILKFHASSKKVANGLQSLKTLVSEFTTLSSQVDYLKFRAVELNEFKPNALEYDELKALSHQLQEGLEVSKVLEQASQYISGTDDTLGIAHGLLEVEKQLSKVAELPWAESSLQKVKEMIQIADDLNFDLESQSSKLANVDGDIEQIESRLHGYQDIMRKMSCLTVEELSEARDALNQKISNFQDIELQLSAALIELTKDLNTWSKIAVGLSMERRRVSTDICKEIQSEFADLAMKDARIEIKLEPRSPQSSIGFKNQLELLLDDRSQLDEFEKRLVSFHLDGLETVEFWLSSNKGEGLQPLDKIASGGEISRIMLALKKVLSEGADACVLVFDEIDAGISGRVADMVGAKLKEMSSDFQILCISHLPQVAAYADRHLKVAKMVIGDRTTSTIKPLTDEQSISEIASMLSGEALNKSSLAHAKSLRKEAISKIKVDHMDRP